MTERQPHAFARVYRQRGRPFVRGEGCRLWDDRGRSFLDLGAGVAVSALGHGHPALVEAVAAQARDLLHTSNLYVVPVVADVVDRIAAATGMDRVFLSNSGAEAIEAALKLARRYFQVVRGERRFRFVAAERSFHGRTFGAVSVTGQPKYWVGFEPILPGVDLVPFGDAAALDAAVGDDTAAILLEPVQGEGGVVVPPPGYLREARRIADARGCLLIFDEIQTGVGRTGPFLASGGDGVDGGVRPDVLTLAKGLAGGLPLGAMVHTEAVSEGLVPGTHMSTFGGNPVCCAAARVVLDQVCDPAFQAEVRRKGERLSARLREGTGDLDAVLEIRGPGLMIGVALDRPAKPAVDMLYDRGVLATVACGSVLRLTPPLVVTDEDIDEGAAHVIDVLRDLVGVN